MKFSSLIFNFIIKKKEKQNHVSFMFIFCDSSEYIYNYTFLFKEIKKKENK